MTHHSSRRRTSYRVSPTTTATAQPNSSSGAPRYTADPCPGVGQAIDSTQVRTTLDRWGGRVSQAVCPECGRRVRVEAKGRRWAVIDHGQPVGEAAG